MKNYKKIAIIFFLWLFIITIFSITVAEAQTTFKAQIPIGGFGEKEIELKEDTGTQFIAQYIQAVYRYGISVGAILATVVLMAAGVVWLTSGGNQGQIGKAKEMITGSLVGLFLLFGSYMILNTINPDLVNFKPQSIEGIDRKVLPSCVQLCINEEEKLEDKYFKDYKKMSKDDCLFIFSSDDRIYCNDDGGLAYGNNGTIANCYCNKDYEIQKFEMIIDIP
jgi:hypothetical protein